VIGRYEEAAAFYRQAADKLIEIRDQLNEGKVRANLAITLENLGRLDEARNEIQRAIERLAQFGHAAAPWITLNILTRIETETDNGAAAATAKRSAIACYLAYRRDGGENHNTEGQLSLAVTESLLAGDSANATSLLRQLATDSDLPSDLSTYIRALQAIVSGSRDRTLADDPDLNYGMAAEILLLIETLEKRG